MSDLEHAQGKFYLHCLDELSKVINATVNDLITVFLFLLLCNFN